MTLKTYSRDKIKRSQPTQWLVNVNLKTGRFFLNNLIADDLGLGRDNYAVVAYDEESQSWLVTFDADEKEGYILQYLANHEYRVRYQFTGRKAATAIINAVKAQRAATFLIGRRPLVVDGKKWYRILHKQPIRVN